MRMCFVIFTLFASNLLAAVPTLEQSYESARAFTKDDLLTVTTGRVTRQWKWTGFGLLTTSISNGDTAYPVAPSAVKADWNLGDLGPGTLVNLSAKIDDDKQFTSEHLSIEAEIEYENLSLKYVIWAYPHAPGLRTQLWLKNKPGTTVKSLAPGISETVALASSNIKSTAFSYAAGLKNNRPDNQYNILGVRKLKDGESWGKASGLILDKGNKGLVLIKESHNHLLLKGGVEVGAYSRQGDLYTADGLGMKPGDLQDDYRFCWANWMVLYTGGEADAQLALKQFDRTRFTVKPERDMFIMANTWGTEDAQQQCFYKAREENVLREIEACADLGLDMIQIDEGWQVSRSNWQPAQLGPLILKRGHVDLVKRDEVLKLHDGTILPQSYDVYPTGFGRVRQAAGKAGIQLGLWFANYVPLEDLKSNYDAGDFKAFKLDFADLKSKQALDSLYYKARDLIQHTDHIAVVNWDVTETPPRMGFYFGRDCGNIYLANRKTFTARNRVVYIPWRQLRDAWELSKYVNLNQFQITINNQDLVPKFAHKYTDAHLSTHAYNLAITLMSSPIFFSELQYFSREARNELRPLINRYKEEREAMFEGYVFPIGQRPDNRSWSGLQNHNPDTGNGYLTIYRERLNTLREGSFQLHFLQPGTQIELEDLLSGKKRVVTLNHASGLSFEIDETPGFLFMKYRKIK